MKLLKLLLISITLFSLTAYANEQDSTKSPLRNGITWGMPTAQVKELETAPVKDSPKFKLLPGSLVYTLSEDGLEYILTYEFKENKLVFVHQHAFSNDKTLEECYNDFMQVENRLISLYGEPQECWPYDTKPGSKDRLQEGVDDDSGLDLGIVNTTWEIKKDKTRITLSMHGNDSSGIYIISIETISDIFMSSME